MDFGYVVLQKNSASFDTKFTSILIISRFNSSPAGLLQPCGKASCNVWVGRSFELRDVRMELGDGGANIASFLSVILERESGVSHLHSSASRQQQDHMAVKTSTKNDTERAREEPE